jgi:perosamine synthetase
MTYTKLIVPYSVPHLPKETRKNLLEVFDSGLISGSGPALDEIQNLLATQINSRYCLCVSNGSAALRLAFQLMGIKPGVRVVLPSWGFHVAANVAHSMGAILEFRDVSLQSWCLELDSLTDLLESNEEIIIVLIHTLGNSTNLQLESVFREKVNIKIIEDSAEALYSKNGERFLGTIFDCGTFSFHAAKTITTGEGGFISVQEKELEEKAKLLRNHGMSSDRHYFHRLAGDNYRLSNLLASLAKSQLEDYEYIISKRKQAYSRYQSNLSKIEGIDFLKESDKSGFFPWGVGLKLDSKVFKPVETIRQALLTFGIDTRPGFTSANDLPYREGKFSQNLINARILSSEIILLPHYPALRDIHIDSICEIILTQKK